MEFIERLIQELSLKCNYEIYYIEDTFQLGLISENSRDVLTDISIINESSIDFCKPILILSPFSLNDKIIPIDFHVNLENCEFKKNVQINQVFNNTVSFNDSIFCEDTCFSGSVFNKNVRFHRVVFNQKVFFTNTVFNSLIDFFQSEFKKEQQFHLTDFNNITIFSNVTFYRAVQFLHNKVSSNSYISFESSKFHFGIDLSRSNFLCKLRFWGITFTQLKYDEICKDLLYRFDNNVLTNNQDVYTSSKKIRETFRIIKQAFRSENNNIEALQFHSYELACYKFEINQNKNKKSERFLLWLNSLSNAHGTSWIKAVKFTLSITLIFYLIFLLLLYPNLKFEFTLVSCGNFLRYYFQLLNITNWQYELYGNENSSWGEILLYISRIFISYGYYQVIQSFRKFTNN